MKQSTNEPPIKKSNPHAGKTPPTAQPPAPAPIPVAQPTQASWKASWFLLPLRLFLGITFVYAGIQKLTDPQYFNSAARGYIGKQIMGFATGSPLHDFLIRFAVPHAHLFGSMVAYGEIAIGIGTLVGLFLRPAAISGFLLSLIFFLTASWHVYPYFYGADIVFAFCWITIILAGPLHSGLPALDAYFWPPLIAALPEEQRLNAIGPASILLGISDATAQTVVPAASKAQSQPWNARQPSQKSKFAAARQARQARRNFLYGIFTGGVAMLSLTVFGSIFLRGRIGDEEHAASTSAGSSATSSTAAGGTPGTNTIAKVSAVPVNSSVSFTIPSNNDPGILVHLNNGQFVAYDATCTHAGCPVDYDPGQQLLVCPCHGAAFDPAKNGAAVQLPADTPLTSVTIHVDSSTGAITL